MNARITINALSEIAMLQHLKIRDLAIINDLTLDFSSGFTALTGETGAGKSIIIGALNLVLGERSSSDDVRSGCDLAVAEALFDLSGRDALLARLTELEILRDEELEESQLILRREVSAQGRSRAQLNGRTVTIGQLREVGDMLVDLHGQHQHQSLLHVELHRRIVDAYGGEALAKALGAFQDAYKSYRNVLKKLRSLQTDEREIERRKDLLEYQLDEIRDAAPEPGEDDRLEEERSRLRHAEALGQSAGESQVVLYEGSEAGDPTVIDMLRACATRLEEAAAMDASLSELSARLESLEAEVDDIASFLRDYVADLEHDPNRLAEVDDRLHVLKRLKSKYGATIADVLNEADKMQEELEGLTLSREEEAALQKQRKALEKDVAFAAEALTAQRRKAANKLARDMVAQLKELQMPEVRFQVAIERNAAEKTTKSSESELSQEGWENETPETKAQADGTAIRFPDRQRYHVHENGADHVEFLISPNAGEDIRPLRRIASGGELSRIMLALKVLLRSMDQVPTLVFDEIDTGISGRTGARIGEKMAELGEHFQVICITHLPQIAARAATHFAVEKTREKGRTLTRVRRLDRAGRLGEIARLLGGDTESEIGRRHAEELLGKG
ncbi:MAG: DNA repair protein RecN [Candidatus Sumerlaeota bacterium]